MDVETRSAGAGVKRCLRQASAAAAWVHSRSGVSAELAGGGQVGGNGILARRRGRWSGEGGRQYFHDQKCCPS